MSSSGNISFKIRRPSPVSRASSADSDFKVPAIPRHLSANNSTPGSPLRRESPKPNSRTYGERDSSDEDEETEDELVTGFDQFGVQRCVSFLCAPHEQLRNSQQHSPLTAFMRSRNLKDLSLFQRRRIKIGESSRGNARTSLCRPVRPPRPVPMAALAD